LPHRRARGIIRQTPRTKGSDAAPDADAADRRAVRHACPHASARRPDIARAYESADTLVVEADGKKLDQQVAQDLFATHGRYPAGVLAHLKAGGFRVEQVPAAAPVATMPAQK